LRGGSRNELYEYPDEQWAYYLCAKEFGWTPEEVDNQPLSIVTWVLAISNAVKEVEIERQSS
jgi:hypothetical protein